MGEGKSLIERLARAAGSVIGRRKAEARPGASSTGADPIERRQSDRRKRSRFELRIPSEDEAFFVLLPPKDSPVPVLDLSVHGFCLDLDSFEGEPPATGTELTTSVMVGAQRYPVRMRVVYRSDSRLGCLVLDEASDWLDEVAKVLDPMRLGKRLREIDPRYMRADPDAPNVRWFQGGPACDLWIWSDEQGQITRVQIFFMWQVVEWSREHGLRTGETSEPPGEGARYAASELYQLQSPPSSETLSFARRLLSAAEIPDPVRELFS